MISADSELDPNQNLNVNGSDCRYTTISEYNFDYSDCSDTFSLLNVNLQSFHAKKSKFEAFLATLQDEFDILVTTETWNSDHNVNLCYMTDYNGVHTYRSSPIPSHGGIGGGVSVFADTRKYKIAKIDELSFCSNVIEICATKILPLYMNDNNEFIVIAVYRPHTDSIENFTDALQSILTSIMLYNKPIFFAGDMNIDLNNNCSSSIDYLNMLYSLNFAPGITKPTRFPTDNQHRATTLDHIFFNKNIYFDSLIFKDDIISDHCSTAIRIQSFMSNNINITRKTFSFRPYSDANLNKLSEKLISTDWSTILCSDDVNTQFNEFQSYLDLSYCSFFPLKTRTVGDKRLKNPWVSGETLSMIRLKSEYYKKFKNNLISREENNRLRNRLNKMIEKDKKEYYRNLFANTNNNMKKSWNIIRSLTGSNAKKN